MAPVEWDPLKDLVSVQDRMNKLFDSALANTNFDPDGGVGAWTPIADVSEREDSLVLSLELPGLKQADIDLRVDGDELVVQGERRTDREQPGEQFHRVERSYGKFMRKFPLPSTVDRDAVEASYKHGVLRVTLAKRGNPKPKAIKVPIS